MTSAVALKCPNCGRSFGALDWLDEHRGTCRFCFHDFEARRFPALTRVKPAARPQAVMVADDSTCFFHKENQAEKVCEDCGRFLCSVCAIPSGPAHRCPACFSKQKEKADVAIPQRMLFDSMALSLAIVPMLFWFFSFITAPATLGLVIYGWRKPGSLVTGPRRWKFVVAGGIAAVQLAMWTLIAVQLWHA